MSEKYKLPVFETERFRLRPFIESDFNNLRLLDTDPEIVFYLGDGKVRSEETTLKILQKHLGDYEKYGLGLYAIECKVSGDFVGRSGLIPWDIEGKLEWEIGYTLLKKYWGKGIATELAKFLRDWAKLNMPTRYVISLIHPENSQSIKVSEKVGMEFWKKVEISDCECNAYRMLLR